MDTDVVLGNLASQMLQEAWNIRTVLAIWDEETVGLFHISKTQIDGIETLSVEQAPPWCQWLLWLRSSCL
jgi:hypothetical protein